jgi:tRNA nucleotidyltransferase (CCA-adding enzyme)
MTSEKIIAKLLKDNLPFKKNLLPPGTYLVGGAVRDALLNRKREYLDLDFVVSDRAIDLAKQIAKEYKTGFVVLDREREIARVVFPNGTVDLARQEGDNIEKDLRRRDFTINAIAYDLETERLIDPLSGLQDLENKFLTMISQANLKDDPLRLLRAYRQAAQLDFAIEPNTKTTIRSIAYSIERVAAERVNTELSYLLNSLTGSKWIEAAWQDGLLKPWFQNIVKEKIQQLTKIDESIQILSNKWGGLIEDFSWCLSMAKLACLVSEVPAEAETELLELKYSRAEIRTVTTALKHLAQLQQLNAPISLREQYFFFLNVGDVFPILAVLAAVTKVDGQIMASLCDRYTNPQDLVAHPQPLITGNDLMQSLNLKPSPKIGELLTEIQIARIKGKISNASEAIAWARLLLE